MNPEPLQGMDVKLANPRGFCAGVDRAIDIVSGPRRFWSSGLRASRGGT